MAIALVSNSCNKPEDAETIAPVSVTPLISIAEITPTTISQFESISIFINYRDGNGDIGTEDADEHTLEILDTRDSILFTFHVPPQSAGLEVAIEGKLNVKIENIILLDQNNDSEDVVFNIRLKDRDGNWSNVVKSSIITINK